MSNFSSGLQQIIPADLASRQELKILSIGFGDERGVAQELNALCECHISNFSYTGIEINLTHNTSQVLNGIPLTFIKANAANLDELEENDIQPNSYDLILLRHPYFHAEESMKEANKIIRRTIPTLLRSKGLLIVSLFHQQETSYFVEVDDEPTMDSFLVSQIYTLNNRRKHYVNNDRSHVLEDACSDHYMFCFENKFNRTESRMIPYAIRPDCLDLTTEKRNKLQSIIDDLGGKFTAKNTFFCPEEYDISNNPLFTLYGTPLLVQQDQPSYSASAAATLFSETTSIERQLAPHRKNKVTALFFKAFDQGLYNKALRTACTSNSDAARVIIRILLSHRETLRLDPNEQTGEAKQNAFHHACRKLGNEGYTLLTDYYQDEGLVDANDNTPSDYLPLVSEDCKHLRSL